MGDVAFWIHCINEWDKHNVPRHACFYESEQNDGMGECPSTYPILYDWLVVNGFDGTKSHERFFGRFCGRELSEPNFRSRNSGNEFPVDEPWEAEDTYAFHEVPGWEYLVQLDYGETGQIVRAKRVRVKSVPVEATGAPVENEQSEDGQDLHSRINLLESLVESLAARVAELEHAEPAPVEVKINFDGTKFSEAMAKAMNDHYAYKLRLRAPF